MRFSKYFPITVCVPIAIIVIGLIVGIACGGMNLGIDFTGGTMMTIHMGGDFDSSVVAEAFVNEGFTEQDSKVAGYAHEQGKACIIVVNKWDAVEGKETNTMELQRRGYAECFSFMGYAPIIFISAQTGYNVNKLMQLIRDVDAENGARVPTGVLNEMLARATARMQPPSDKGRRLKIYYLTQASTRPPTFVAFVNAKHLFHFSYQRYLINQIRENFGLEHTPIRLVVRERGSGEVGAKDV